MQSNTGKNNLFHFNDNEKIKVEEMFVNYRMMEVIKELMKANNIKTKSEFAKKMGVSSAYISKLFRSDKNFNVNFIVRAQRVFDTTFVFSVKSEQVKKDNEYIIMAFPDKYAVNVKPNYEKKPIHELSFSKISSKSDFNYNYVIREQ